MRERVTIGEDGSKASTNVSRRARLQLAIGKAAGRELVMPQSYVVAAGRKWSNSGAPDPEPAAIPVTVSDIVITGEGTGRVRVDTADKSVFHIVNPIEGRRPTNVVIRDFARLAQPQRVLGHSGLSDDYFIVRFEGAHRCAVENVTLSGSLGITFQFAQTISYSRPRNFDGAGAISVAANTVALAAHGVSTGQAVVLAAPTPGTGVVPGGVVANREYFAIRVDEDTLKLAETQVDAMEGKALDIKANGSGKLCLWRPLRASSQNSSHACNHPACSFLFLQLAGEQDGLHSEHRADGLDADGAGRAGGSGIRLTGFNFAPCRNNRLHGNSVSRFANGLSLQHFVSNNEIDHTSLDCQNGALVVRQAKGSSEWGSWSAADATSQGNKIHLTASGGEYGVYDDGGANNEWFVDIRDSGNTAIFLSDGGRAAGVSTANSFRGVIRRPGLRGADIRGTNTTVDLDIQGNGAGSTQFGLLCSGEDIRGAVRVAGATVGVQLNGNGGSLNVKIRNCGTALVVNGSNIVLMCDIDGDVVLGTKSSNITLVGRINGKITNAGARNDVSQLT